MTKMRLYTNEQVHQIVDQVLLKLDEAVIPDPEPAHLNNCISQKASPSHDKISLTIAEAAQLIGISRPKMYELVRTGQFHTVNIGKKILISRQSLEKWLKEGESYGKEAC